MVDEKLFDDSVKLASLWLAKTQAQNPQTLRDEVEGSVQAIYHGLLAVRDRINSGTL
jgi:hypothetical protein